MANPPSPRKPSWKDAAGPSRPTTGPQQDWKHPAEAPAGARPWWKTKPAKLTFVSSALLGVGALAIVVLLWFRPIKPMRLLLIGAGYETNLPVPHNVPGVGGLNALETWAAGHNDWAGSDRRKRIEVKREELGSDDAAVTRPLLSDSWWERKPETVVVFVAAHGVGRSEDGQAIPYLVRQDANLRDRAALYPFGQLLDALGKLPSKTKKLLLVDTTGVTAHWPLGQLHNDFTRALKGLVGSRKVPNLVVISSSDEGERSWADPIRGQTIFSHFVQEGLRGGADKKPTGDGNERVDALELYQYVRAKVEHWARHNRNSPQRPVLIGAKQDAKKMVLVSYENYQPAAAPPAETEPDYPKLRAAWEKCRALRQASPPPAVYSPHLWRQYLDTLLRYEELVRAGDEGTAAKLLEQLGILKGRIEAARALLPGAESFQLTLALADVHGTRLAPPAEGAKQREAQLMKLWEDRDPAKEYGKALTALGTRERALLRLRLSRRVVRRVAEAPEKLLAPGRRALAALDDARPPWRPAEAHYLVMLWPGRDAGWPSPVRPLLEKKEWPLLGKSVGVRLLAEQAALGLGKEKPSEQLPPRSEEVLPWVRGLVEQADEKRRLGQDLLFTSEPERWREAEKLLGSAEALFGQAQELGLAVRRALSERDKALAELPYYTRWLAAEPLGPEDDLARLWKNTHELRRRLEGPPSGKDADGKKQTEAARAQAAELDKLTQAVEDDFKKVTDSHQKVAAKDNATANTQDRWHEIEKVLVVPFLAPGLRMTLVQASRRMARKFDAATPRATSAAGADSEKTAEQARRAAQRQGRLAVALLGEDWPEHRDAAEAILHPAEGNWEGSLARAGQRVGEVLNRMPEDAQARTEKAAKADLETAAAELRVAARLARQVEGSLVGPPRLTADPVGQQRRLALHDLLCWQARRAFLDYWAAEKQGFEDRPYFRLAGWAFLRDAQDLVVAKAAEGAAKQPSPRLARVNAERAKLEAPGRVTLEWSPSRDPGQFQEGPNELPLTDQPKGVERFYRLRAPEGAPKGQPVRWVERDAGLRPGGEDEGGQRAVELGRPFAARIVVDEKVAGGPNPRRHRVVGFFRGHRSEVVTRVRWYQEPDLTIALPPPRSEGRLAVQTKRQLYYRYGATNAAIALVLDCSGSMNERQAPGGPTRWQAATKALRSVLEQLPKGTTVSLRAFGAEQFEGDMPQFGGIKQVWKAHKWDPEKLDERMRPVDRLRPKYATPLVRSIWMAREDFPGGFKGARTIVVLTDGADSIFYDKTVPDPAVQEIGKTIPEFMRKVFQGSGIQINVIGFQVSEEEMEWRSYGEFKAALKDLKGEYYDARDTERLTVALRRSLLQMYFWVDTAEGKAVPDLPDEGKDISRSDRHENPRWIDLKNGPYVVRVPSVRSVRQHVLLGRGESLLLDLVQDKAGRPALRRGLYGKSDFVSADVPKASASGWLLAAPQNLQLPGGSDLQILATLEKDTKVADPRDEIKMVRPRWAWFEVPAPDGKGPAPRLRVRSREGYPAPAWGLDLPRWPTGAPSTLKAWWTERPFPGRDQMTFPEALRQVHRPWPTERKPEEVILESLGVEPYRLETEKGKPPRLERCLVVRLRYPVKRGPYFVQLLDWHQGQEHRFYREAGKYTGIFWPVPGELNELSLNLISVAELKKKAPGGEKGTTLELGAPEDRRHPVP
jgi:hypothetical protein